jgi:hypothetical protein
VAPTRWLVFLDSCRLRVNPSHTAPFGRVVSTPTAADDNDSERGEAGTNAPHGVGHYPESTADDNDSERGEAGTNAPHGVGH